MRKVLSHPLTLPIACTVVTAVAAVIASKAKHQKTRDIAQLVATAVEMLTAAGPALMSKKEG